MQNVFRETAVRPTLEPTASICRCASVTPSLVDQAMRPSEANEFASQMAAKGANGEQRVFREMFCNCFYLARSLAVTQRTRMSVISLARRRHFLKFLRALTKVNFASWTVSLVLPENSACRNLHAKTYSKHKSHRAHCASLMDSAVTRAHNAFERRALFCSMSTWPRDHVISQRRVQCP